MEQRPVRTKLRKRKKQWPGGLYLMVGATVAAGGALSAGAIYSWLGWMTFFTAMAFRLMPDDALRLWAIAIGFFSAGCSGAIAGFTTWLGLYRLVAHPRRLFLNTWLVWTILGTAFWVVECGLSSGTALLLGGGVAARAVMIATAAWLRHSHR